MFLLLKRINTLSKKNTKSDFFVRSVDLNQRKEITTNVERSQHKNDKMMILVDLNQQCW